VPAGVGCSQRTPTRRPCFGWALKRTAWDGFELLSQMHLQPYTAAAIMCFPNNTRRVVKLQLSMTSVAGKEHRFARRETAGVEASDEMHAALGHTGRNIRPEAFAGSHGSYLRRSNAVDRPITTMLRSMTHSPSSKYVTANCRRSLFPTLEIAGLRPVDRLIPAKTADTSSASKVRCTSLPNI